MIPALRIAATGMAAQQTRTEVIANNLANVNTTAFKRSRASFEDLLYQSMREVQVVGTSGADTLGAIQVGRGVRLAAVNRANAQGTLENTQRELDVAVEPGISIPSGAGQISISRTGIVSALRGNGELVQLGQISLHRFPNPSGLMALGENLYTETPASGVPLEGMPEDEGFGRIVQGYLESSNVEIVTEMVEMIAAQRAYEINSKSVKAADEMSEVATQLIR